MTFRSDATEGVWSPTQNVAVQTEANVVAIFFFHQCVFYDPTHPIRGCEKIIWNFALKGKALEIHQVIITNVVGSQKSGIFSLPASRVSRVQGF